SASRLYEYSPPWPLGLGGVFIHAERGARVFHGCGDRPPLDPQGTVGRLRTYPMPLAAAAPAERVPPWSGTRAFQAGKRAGIFPPISFCRDWSASVPSARLNLNFTCLGTHYVRIRPSHPLSGASCSAGLLRR